MRRLLLVGTAVALAATTGVSAAAPRAVCNIVKDPKGDSAITPSTALDILSADLSTGQRSLKAVVRLAKIDGDPTVAHGQQYKVNFVAGGIDHFVRVQNVAGLGPTFDYGYQGPTGSVSSGTTSGKIDTAKNEVTFTVPKSAFKGVKGGTVTEITARAYVFAGAVFQPVDTATGANYKDLTPSCIGNA